MAFFKNLIFFALAVYAVSAESEEVNREKRGAYVVAAPAPVLSYSSAVPAAYPSYAAYSAAYPAYAYKYPASTYPAATYPAYAAATPYAAYPAAYPAYPSYYEDDGKYYPGKYEKTYYPAYKTAYPVAYPF